jgi:hypothetical protein
MTVIGITIILTMLSLQKHHIMDLYCIVRDLVPEEPKEKGGRPPLMTKQEVLTILIWNVCTLHQKTLKDIHSSLCMYHSDDFTHIPKYNAFIKTCHDCIPLLEKILSILLVQSAPLRIVDSTMIPVCKLVRADRHKVAKSIATYGKNHQGWHYGFKLHASVNMEGRLAQVYFTGANFYDAQALPFILNKHTRIAVGDGTYQASVMRARIWREYKCHVVAPVHFKQTKKLITYWQHKLLTFRPKIETVFDYLKEHLHFVTSFPRSINGYLLHYLKTLVGYCFLTC